MYSETSNKKDINIENIADRIKLVQSKLVHEATSKNSNSTVLVIPQVFSSDNMVSNLITKIRSKDANTSNTKTINRLNDNLQDILRNYNYELSRNNNKADTVLDKYIQQVRDILTTGYNELS